MKCLSESIFVQNTEKIQVAVNIKFWLAHALEKGGEKWTILTWLKPWN